MTDESTHADAESETVEEELATQLEGWTVQLQEALEGQKKLAEERLDQLKYLQADFDNYRKKFDREKELIIALAEDRLVTELLPIVDDCERILKGTTETVQREGIVLLNKNFMKVLENHGLKRIESVGKKFDPYFHEAFCVEKCDCDNGTILEEFQPGYMLKMKVIRPAKVKVAEKKSEE
ncbi:MAG: nucleotide exchange factor GrpE [Methanomicrobiales archaeon]|nr:nucleotide exchange factor GrpE [Methanomicrobiales archaeon]